MRLVVPWESFSVAPARAVLVPRSAARGLRRLGDRGRSVGRSDLEADWVAPLLDVAAAGVGCGWAGLMVGWPL